VNAHQADFPVRRLCRVLGVSHSGFYDWQRRGPSAHEIADRVLTERIRQVHADSQATYGRPRVRAALAAQGCAVSGKRIARLMRAAGLQGVSRRRSRIVTTRRDPRLRPAPDLVERRFEADAPDQLWVADITYVPAGGDFVYLAIVLDVWSRRVVGWSVGETMHTDLVLAALNMALAQRRPRAGLIHHTDQGSQYTSLAFGQRCRDMGVRPSMGSVGDAYDNAMAESFFATLEVELLARRRFATKAEARTALFCWIEGWYNPRRLHSGLGYRSPARFERDHREATVRDAITLSTPTRLEPELPTVGARVAGAAPPVDNSAAASMPNTEPTSRLETPADNRP
jgi:putative transposase